MDVLKELEATRGGVCGRNPVGSACVRPVLYPPLSSHVSLFTPYPHLFSLSLSVFQGHTHTHKSIYPLSTIMLPALGCKSYLKLSLQTLSWRNLSKAHSADPQMSSNPLIMGYHWPVSGDVTQEKPQGRTDADLINPLSIRYNISDFLIYFN